MLILLALSLNLIVLIENRRVLLGRFGAFSHAKTILFSHKFHLQFPPQLHKPVHAKLAFMQLQRPLHAVLQPHRISS